MKPNYNNLNLQCSLTIQCDKGDWYISFQVNNSYDLKSNKNKVAITRWLLKTWKEVKSKYKGKTLYCEPWGEDGGFEYRSSIYSKLGFEWDDKITMVIDL